MKKTLTFYSILFILFLILQRGAGILTKIVLVNSITPYEYGIITLVALSIPTLLQILTNFNFLQILSHSEEGSQYFGFCIFTSLISVSIISLLLFVFREPVFLYLNLPPDEFNLFYLTILISIICVSILLDFQGLFTGLKLYSVPGIVLALPSIFRLLGTIVLISIQWVSLEIILLLFAISNVIPLIFIISKKKYWGYIKNIFSIHIPSRQILLFATALFTISSFSTIGASIIKIVISHELGIEWQGYFDVSMTLGTLVIFSLSTMGFISLPEATNPNKEAISKKGGLFDVTRLLFAVTIFVIVLLYFYSDFIVKLLFSEDYLISANYVGILALAYLFFFIQLYMANVYLASRPSTKEHLYYTFIPLLLLPLFYFFTQISIEYCKILGIGNGFIGAYLSYAIISLLLLTITVYLSKDRSSLIKLLENYPRLVVSILIVVLINSIIHFEPIQGIIISSIIFLFLIIQLHYIEKDLFLEIFKK